MTQTISFETLGHLPSSQLTPEEWMAQHREMHRFFRGPRDTRLPAFLSQLVEKVCVLRSSLEQVMVAFDGNPQGFGAFRKALEAGPASLLEDLWHVESLIRLLENYRSRIDWREQDVLEMILEFLRVCPDTCNAAGESLRRELDALEGLRKTNPREHTRAVEGLISEARGSLPGLMQAVHHLEERPSRREGLDQAGLADLVEALGRTLGATSSGLSLPDEPEELWDLLHREALEEWRNKGIGIPLKAFEKASLFLLEALPVQKKGHARFVRWLIENPDSYRRLLATAYAAWPARCERLDELTDRYNRLPEHAGYTVQYGDEEKRIFLYAFFLRPDVVEAVAERESRKDIYRVLWGLGSKAHLPRTLHELHGIFGYVTPEVFERVVDTLKLDPVDVIRVIASFKQYSADPAGEILIYLCKGTACFLRGQPELSRRLASEIDAREGELGRNGVQFIEMDCFGVCHLAPVIKTGDAFLGGKTPEDVPGLLEQLLKGPSYENRISFLNRIREVLSPGCSSEPLEEMRVVSVIGGEALGQAQGERKEQAQDKLCGCPIQIDAEGRVSVRSEDGEQKPGSRQAGKLGGPEAKKREDQPPTLPTSRRELGWLVSRSLTFSYTGPDGVEQTGALVLDENRQVLKQVHFRSAVLEEELRKTIRPHARIADGMVTVEKPDGDSWILGAYKANAIVVELDGAERPSTGSERTEGIGSGRNAIVILSGSGRQSPPEEDEGWQAGEAAQEEESDAFLAGQDRLVLDFTPGVDPDEIDSYIRRGGYEAVHRVLGLREEPRWEPRDIVIEVSNARLRGRGGAGFPTGRKWDGTRLAKCVVEETDENQDPIKLIVANGDEGDPGAFMDRTLIQERPHQLIEGMILAALAVEARYGVIYVRKEYEDAVRRLEHALFQARRRGFLGESIFGVEGLNFDLEIRLGAGAFVAGEKRAIMRAIEGEAAEPTLKAVSNTIRGLWGKPTLLNNVETFANVPLIIQKGGEWYADQGTERSGGSKIFSVAGIVRQTGLVEVVFGKALSDIIAICGGIKEGERLAGVQIGGPSGAILSLTGVRSYLLHTPLDFDTFDQVGAMLGSGGLVFIGEKDDVVRLARHFTDWLSEESCGQCPPCLQGTVSLGRTLDLILQGEGTSDHIHALWAKSDAIKAGSQCGLGMTAANPVTSALRFFPQAFLHYVLLNPRVDRLEIFKTLEALKLLTRENMEGIRGRQRRLEGYVFTLKKHLLRNLFVELERLDQYRPPHQQCAGRFLELLFVAPHEVGGRDVTLECSLEEMERQRLYIQDRIYESVPMAEVVG